jgi:hypothetical protein
MSTVHQRKQYSVWVYYTSKYLTEARDWLNDHIPEGWMRDGAGTDFRTGVKDWNIVGHDNPDEVVAIYKRRCAELVEEGVIYDGWRVELTPYDDDSDDDDDDDEQVSKPPTDKPMSGRPAMAIRPVVKEEHPDMKPIEVTREVARRWQGMSHEERVGWIM